MREKLIFNILNSETKKKEIKQVESIVINIDEVEHFTVDVNNSNKTISILFSLKYTDTSERALLNIKAIKFKDIWKDTLDKKEDLNYNIKKLHRVISEAIANNTASVFNLY